MVTVNNMHVTLSTCILNNIGGAIVWHMEIPYNLLRKSWWKIMSKKVIVLKLDNKGNIFDTIHRISSFYLLLGVLS